MTFLSRSIVILILALGVASPCVAGDKNDDKKTAAITAKIDRYFESYWKDESITPAPPVGDEQFLRRLYLDLTGRIPPASTVRAFAESKDPNKRRSTIEALLESAGYVSHFTNTLRDQWLPDTPTMNPNSAVRRSFEDWLRSRLAGNVAYDQMVREILTADEASPLASTTASPIGFYAARQRKPEEIAAATSRLFLGVSLECAQCHGHPFAVWSKKQFWEFAAFFSNARRANDRVGIEARIMIPGTTHTVEARFLDDTAPKWKEKNGPRTVLAQWITKPGNKLFARAAVNQLWTHFFGEALAESQFDLSDDPLHQQLLDDLADEMIRNDYDLKQMMRAMVRSRPYQLASRESHASQRESQSFAKFTIKGMSAEQLYDSILLATGIPSLPDQPARGTFRPAMAPRQRIIDLFKSEERAHERATSILQSLELMNGGFLHEVTRPNGNGTLAAITEAPFLSTRQRIEALYVVALSRKPRSDELANVLRYVEKDKADAAMKQALSDVFWALLNSSEFTLNH